MTGCASIDRTFQSKPSKDTDYGAAPTNIEARIVEYCENEFRWDRQRNSYKFERARRGYVTEGRQLVFTGYVVPFQNSVSRQICYAVFVRDRLEKIYPSAMNVWDRNEKNYARVSLRGRYGPVDAYINFIEE